LRQLLASVLLVLKSRLNTKSAMMIFGILRLSCVIERVRSKRMRWKANKTALLLLVPQHTFDR
jgi:hypothetical protein